MLRNFKLKKEVLEVAQILIDRKGLRWAILTICLMAIGPIAASLQPVFLKMIVDSFGTGQYLLRTALAGLFFALLLAEGANSLGDVCCSILQQKAAYLLSLRFMQKIPEMYIERIQKKNSAQILQIVSTARSSIQSCIRISCANLLPTAVRTITACVVLAYLGDWVVILALLYYAAAYGMYNVASGRKVFEQQTNLIHKLSESARISGDTLNNIEYIKTQGFSQPLIDRYESTHSAILIAEARYNRLICRNRLVRVALFATTFLVCITHTAFAAIDGKASVGQIVLVGTYMYQICSPLDSLLGMYRGVREAMLGLSPYLKLLFDESNNESRLPTIKRKDLSTVSSLRGRGITFSYQHRPPTLRDADFEFHSGVVYGLKGESGSGKSTLLRILLGLYLPQSGNIFVDNHDMRNLLLEEFRSAVAYVPQEPAIFNDSLEFNIRIARPHASQADLDLVIERACLTTLVERLPDGLSSMIGDRGLMISGGERQRIGIARALLKNAPIIILDEATSALDEKNEALILSEICSKRMEKLIIVVGHRPSALIHIDKLLILKDGVLIEADRAS